eukprot:5383474-Prorocentrum_lima.AAC.1
MVLAVSGNIPYSSIPSDGLVAPTTTRACPASASGVAAVDAPIQRWAYVNMGAYHSLDDPSIANGPSLKD